MTILSLLQAAPPPPPGGEGLAWNEVLREYIKFVGYFLAIGAAAYRYLILPRFDRSEEGAVIGRRSAALLGVTGVFLLLLSLLGGIEMNALLHGKTFIQSMPKAVGRFRFQLVAMATSLVGYTLARRASPRIGWPLAAIGILGVVLQPLITSRGLAGRVNAVHILAASTWLGTLTVMLFTGIRALLRAPASGTSRATAAAGIVNAFTPVALTAATVLALSGATTAWLHLKHLSNLWETGYGKALLVKLALVLAVVSMGWWNWKRVKPALAEADESIHRLNRSATTELIFAALVLAATAVLVSLPSPK
ncbi:MAG: CopD family protein [Armatimonadetes bacterium]|nr:CopD family protein [Armatimonadota bacterium]